MPKITKKITKKTSKKKVHRSPSKRTTKKHTIPGPVKIESLKEFIINGNDDEEKSIIDYVEWQSRKDNEKVKHLEKVKTENIFGQPMDAWDVKTNKNRWWVITNPTNLYSQKLFPSLDYTFSFHIGLTTRMQQSHITQQQLVIHDDIEELWNKIALIQDRFFKSKNVEDFQEIGIKCRECLLLLIRKISDNSMIPNDVEIPQKANFIIWSEHIARHYFPGPSKEKVRSHFKDLSKSTWQLANWLTHSHSSEKTDAMLTVGATENILEIFIAARANHESKNNPT